MPDVCGVTKGSSDVLSSYLSGTKRSAVQVDGDHAALLYVFGHDCNQMVPLTWDQHVGAAESQRRRQ